jgi:hypothetical protein
MSLIDSIALMIERHGQDVVVRRRTGTTSSFSPSVTVKGRVHSFRPEELIGGIQQGDRRVTIAPSVLVSAGWNTGDAPRKGDQVLIDSQVFTVQACEPRYYAGSLARYDIWIRG